MSDLELLKRYLQNEIDTGSNKIFVFDKDYNSIEFKAIDALNEINDLQTKLQQKENKEKKNVNDKYYDMICRFNADNHLKIRELEDQMYAFGKSFWEIEKDLFMKHNKIIMKDIELLDELEYNLRHNLIKIVEIDKGSDKE